MLNFLKNKNNYCQICFYCIAGIIILFGIYIRLRFYLAKIPMWIDEIMLASSFVDRNLLDVFLPLDAYQKAPPMFSWFVLLIRKFFGINEFSLRFITFILSTLSILSFFILIKKYVKNKIGVLAGLSLFVFCIPLIYFSAEFKPYGCDVFFCIALLMLYEYFNLVKINIKQTIIYSITASLLVLMSFPSVFVIFAMIISKICKEQKFDKKVYWIITVIFITGLFLLLSDYNTYEFLHIYWNNVEHGFALSAPLNLIRNFFCDACEYYIYNFNNQFLIYVMFMLITGLGLLIKERRENSILLISILLITIIASLLNLYPLKPKLVLFLLPIFIILMSKSFDIIYYLKSYCLKWVLSIFMLISIIAVLGINIPYLNITENQLIYYNHSVQSRNKSLDDRLAVKKYCKELLDNYKINDQILSSEEFVICLKYYKSYYKIKKDLQIYSYADINSEELSAKDYKDRIENFIDKNLDNNGKMWFFGRDDEYYFKSPEKRVLDIILHSYKLNYECFQHKDLYLIHTK